MRRTKMFIGAATLVAAAVAAVPSPGYAQDLCGNNVNDPCSSASSWTTSYSQAEVFRQQLEAQVAAQNANLLSSAIQSASPQYRAIVTYIR